MTVGDKRNPTCIPANSSKTIIGKVPKVDRKSTYLVEKTEDSNLPIGVGVNNTLVTPSKSGLVSVILINNNNHNVWIRQPLYAADLWEVEPKEWEYETVLSREEGTNNVTINFVQVPPEEFREDIFSNAAEAKENDPLGKLITETMREKKDLSLVHLRIMTHQTLISKGSVNDFRSR